jgi:hypothetical protein
MRLETIVPYSPSLSSGLLKSALPPRRHGTSLRLMLRGVLISVYEKI